MSKVKLLGLLVFGLNSISAWAQSDTIVFVCEHGSAKSVIAAAYFNKLATRNGLSWKAVARGTDPDEVISPKTEKLLKSEGLFDNTFVPQKISQAEIDNARRVYWFFPLPTNLATGDKARSWQHIKAVNEDFPRLRDDIVRELRPLIDSLRKIQK